MSIKLQEAYKTPYNWTRIENSLTIQNKQH